MWAGWCPLQKTKLLREEQDVELFFVLRPNKSAKKIEQRGKPVSKHREEHPLPPGQEGEERHPSEHV